MDNDEYKVEFSESLPVKFLKMENVKMYDDDGNVILCKCGQPVTDVIAGKDTYLARCSNCVSGENNDDPEANLIFNTWKKAFTQTYETLWSREERYTLNKIRSELIDTLESNLNSGEKSDG